MARRGGAPRRRIKVTCYDPDAGESITFTVYPGCDGLRHVVGRLHKRALDYYRTTSLTDRRHKRRMS